VTWRFAGPCANRAAMAVLAALIWVNLGRQAVGLRLLARQPRRETCVWGGGCTGSCHDPEVLAFLDDPGPDHDYLPRRRLVERVQANLVLDGVDQFAEL
jgi:hypothetical protein